MDGQKKTWVKPELTQYGSIEEITLQTIKAKQLGLIDDFGIGGISDPTS